MADNTTQGSGATIGTDDVGGVHFQRVKLDLGTENNSAKLVASNAAKPANLAVFPVGAEFNSVAPTFDDGDQVALQTDVNGNMKVTLATGIAGENWTVNRMMVENYYTYSRKTASGSVLSAAGFIHNITISPSTATPTAGLLTIYDNTAASGTVIFSEWVFASTPAHTVTIDASVATGIYVSFDGTLANVSTTVSYRTN